MYKGAVSTKRSPEDLLLDQIDYGRKKTGEGLFKKKHFIPETKDVSAPDPKPAAKPEPKTKGQIDLDNEPILYCLRCGKEITKDSSNSAKQYRVRKFCSTACSSKANRNRLQKISEPKPKANTPITWEGIAWGLRYCGKKEKEIQGLKDIFDAGYAAGAGAK